MFMPASTPLMIYLTLLSACAATAHWRRLGDDHRQHAWLGLTVALVLMWSLPTRVSGIDLHLSGASLAALMFGARLAAISLSVAVGVSGYVSQVAAPELGLQGIALTLLPALLTVAIQRLIQSRLPRHIFVYLFAVGFGGTFVANALSVLSFAWASSMSWANTPFHVSVLPEDYLAYRLLLCWGEAMLTGMLVAIFVVYRPRWVSTFRDEVYLAKSIDKRQPHKTKDKGSR